MKKAIFVLAIAIIVLGGIAGYLYFKENNVIRESVTNEIEPNVMVFEKEEKKVQIYQGTERPIAVMIDNHISAMPHAGLSKAYLVYEVIVEGGESRLMAVFKGQNVENIGPIRSSRHYFLDYAFENDAIYVHYGWSPQAEKDISSLKVNNINGISENTDAFWRTKLRSAPHNVISSTDKIKEIAKNKGYRTESSAESLLKYTVDEVNLGKTKEEIASTMNVLAIENTTPTEIATAETAKLINIKYSDSNKVKWVYNEDTKNYTRYSKGKEETEWINGTESVPFKNIIVEYVKNSPLNDGEGKDRQTLDTTGTKDGYYITNGKAIKIKCTKDTRKSKTLYTDLNGNEIKVNDGNTFIQIVPVKYEISLE